MNGSASSRNRLYRVRQWRPSRRAGIVLGTLALVVLVVWLLFDWNWFKPPLERAVSSATGREFRIDGDLDVDLGRTITVSADQLRLANAPWSKEPRMGSAERVEIDIAPWPLLALRLRMKEVRATRANVWLETAPRGGGNWVFDDGKPDAAETDEPRWRLDRLWIEDSRLRFTDAAEKTDIDITLDSVAPEAAQRAQPAQAAAPVAVKGRGHWRGAAFRLEGQAASPLALADSDTPYRIDLDARAGATRASASGTLTNPFRFQTFDVQMQLAGKDLEDLYPLLGLALPPSPPYRLDGRLRRNGDVWRYDGFKGVVGDSDLAGDVQVDVSGARPMFTAQLLSRRLDFDDLAGFLGAPPSTGGKETANAEQKAEAAKRAASPRLLPDTPYDLTKLNAMDADVRWRAERIHAPKLPMIDDMDAHLLLDGGVLRLEPLNFGVAGGDVRSTIRMDARKQPIDTRARIAVRGVELPKLLAQAELAQGAAGRIGGDISLHGRGDSIAAILGSADGDVGLGMGRGRISNLVMELAGLDIAESLKFLLTKDRQVPIRCAFADFGVQDGLMTSRALAFDSTDTIIVGEGTINLEDESLDLLLRPRPKDRSILSLRSPLRVGGTFKDPSFRPDFAALGLRGAVALALASITPPAALLATFETGPGEDSDCGGKYAR
ncbi:AsmA family protein [Pseudoxanthomonas daejeonensis]|uniref:AsmA family protein n=1 Tax=Pseudoxanthomonas daejeonensis TaxID=266062 RepID=A0ABQ6ZAI1_9GAMM|nr:AsmA family protein [Pseudoxanthomonas daejeonensis]KAF1696788.1 AsmA family protein [Pseudoxanthomonas daejeonensis]